LWHHCVWLRKKVSSRLVESLVAELRFITSRFVTSRSCARHHDIWRRGLWQPGGVLVASRFVESRFVVPLFVAFCVFRVCSCAVVCIWLQLYFVAVFLYSLDLIMRNTHNTTSLEVTRESSRAPPRYPLPLRRGYLLIHKLAKFIATASYNYHHDQTKQCD
jgi:hypothetical protein